mgnify:CR=1 FL=1
MVNIIVDDVIQERFLKFTNSLTETISQLTKNKVYEHQLTYSIWDAKDRQVLKRILRYLSDNGYLISHEVDDKNEIVNIYIKWSP